MPESQRPDEGPGPWRPERMKGARVQAGTEALGRRETALSKRSVANRASDVRDKQMENVRTTAWLRREATELTP
ncbi:hypothetical protein CCHR01_13514 [Colletotrichum chrysophilum]|uniref:Uncharacterized protein n=1 Tax=Colletotrichum chrysophilum TaxID=1836956 RepID=A0AAD9EDM6_9PEZI|nr:hypothetical protein CCHR01_13514 [Colletotrichum chrysophilum]